MSEPLKIVPPDPVVNVTVPNKKILVDYIQQIIDREKPQGDFSYFRIERNDCGCLLDCKKVEDIPEKTYKCEHGHTIILYTDELQGN